MTDLLIVGGGAAGLAAAACAQQLGDTVMVLERMDRVGKKLLATGNGRCNIMNLRKPVYPSGGDFARQVLRAMPPASQIRFWRSIGLFLREEAEGRVYPCTGQAATVLDVLRLAVPESCIRTGQTVSGLEYRQGAWHVYTEEGDHAARRVLLAGGGAAQKALGSDGSCVRLLRDRGYPASPLRPALTQLKTALEPIRGLDGIRVRAGVRVLAGGRCIHQEHGEVLFTSYGLSGVCILQCSAYADCPGSEISLHLYEGLGLSESELTEELLMRAEKQPEHLLSGMLPLRVAQAVLRQAMPEKKRIDRHCVRDIVQVMGDFRIPVKGLQGLEHAQVTRGGIDPSCFDPDTMQSRTEPGLYAAGEMLDVDGDCGGFNLMFATAGGLLAAKCGRKAPWEENT